MLSWFTVAIPTRDSAGWIAQLLTYYRRHAITPVILLDSRTTDDTGRIARDYGCVVVPVENFVFTEGIVSLTRRCAETPWVMFMHDDEAPSTELIGRLHGPPPSEMVQSVALSRRWAWHVPGQPLAYGKTDQWPDRTGRPGLDHHWRLFRPQQVTFIDAVHSEGFLIDRWMRFPPEAYFVHFEWVLRTCAQRVVKLRGYDRYRYGYGRFFEKMYLPERLGPEVISYPPFGYDDFDELAAAYYAARQNDVIVPRKSLREIYAQVRHDVMSTVFPPRPGIEPDDRKGLTPALEKEILEGA